MIKTKRLKLVKFDVKYADDLLELWGDYEVIKYTYMPLINSKEQCIDKIKMFIDYTDQNFVNNFIILLNNKAIGIVGSPIKDMKKKKFGLYYQLSRAYWGKGYISEAACAFMQYLKDSFPDASINAEAAAVNPASISILKKLGLKKTGINKKGFKCNDLELDLIEFSNLRGKILVSACVVGCNCKYNGKNNLNPKVVEFLKDKEVIKVCPEVLAGMTTPRPSAEIVDGHVTECNGKDVHKDYIKGVKLALEKIKNEDIGLAVLQSRSPTCGVNNIYDGSFSGKLIEGTGVFAKVLIEKGYNVVDSEDIE